MWLKRLKPEHLSPPSHEAPADGGASPTHAAARLRGQYGGALRCRWAFAASTHHMRSSTRRGNARWSASPPSPTDWPSADKLCPMGPTAIVLETTTMPISESVPCQAVAARAPDKRPAE